MVCEILHWLLPLDMTKINDTKDDLLIFTLNSICYHIKIDLQPQLLTVVGVDYLILLLY